MRQNTAVMLRRDKTLQWC